MSDTCHGCGRSLAEYDAETEWCVACAPELHDGPVPKEVRG
jgi:hypothetical protein